jgi:hypothetical protein
MILASLLLRVFTPTSLPFGGNHVHHVNHLKITVQTITVQTINSDNVIQNFNPSVTYTVKL